MKKIKEFLTIIRFGLAYYDYDPLPLRLLLCGIMLICMGYLAHEWMDATCRSQCYPFSSMMYTGVSNFWLIVFLPGGLVFIFGLLATYGYIKFLYLAVKDHFIF